MQLLSNYSFIYENPKVYIPARTKRDEYLREMITICSCCGKMDLDVSVGCEEYLDIDMCMNCYDLGYRDFTNSKLEKTIESNYTDDTDITPRNIMKYRSPFPYYYHCLNSNKLDAFIKSIDFSRIGRKYIN